MTFFTPSVHQSRTSLVLLTGLAVGSVMALAFVSSANAQSTSAEALETPEANSNVFNAGEGSIRSPFDLYHRANLANDRTPAEFMEYQRSVLSSEVESLRIRQQESLQGQPSQPTEAMPSPEIDTPPTP